MQSSINITPEIAKQLCQGTCKKCEFKSCIQKNNWCPYAWGLADDLGSCKGFYKSNYWQRKDYEEELAGRRTAMVEKGIMPKFILGQTVYEAGGWGNWGDRYIVERTIRKMYPSGDLEYWEYQVDGHKDYSFVDHPISGQSVIFATVQECQRYIMENFIEETRRNAESLIQKARRLGMAIDGAEIKFLEPPKNSVEND